MILSKCRKNKKETYISFFLHYIKLIENNKNSSINNTEGMQYK